MALTVNPAVSGTRRNWVLSSLGFTVGAFAGALVSLLAMLIVALALLSFLPHAVVIAIAVVTIAWAVLHDLGLPLPLPYRRQQVPEWLRNALPVGVVATVFGFQLGIGFLTLFTYSTQLAVLVALPFLPSVGAMIGVVAIFALGKAIVLATTIGTTSTDEIASRFQWDKRRAHTLRMTTATASVLVAVALVASQ
jgi:acyl-CoA synthetase (AMP-forming)/AMP-acid ligase II